MSYEVVLVKTKKFFLTNASRQSWNVIDKGLRGHGTHGGRGILAPEFKPYVFVPQRLQINVDAESSTYGGQSPRPRQVSSYLVIFVKVSFGETWFGVGVDVVRVRSPKPLGRS